MTDRNKKTDDSDNENRDVFFSGRTRIDVRAFFLGQRLDLKALEQTRRLTTSPYVIQAGHDGYAVLFRYGAVVLFGMGPIEETSFLRDMEPFVVNPISHIETEDAAVTITPGTAETVDPESIRISGWSIERIQLIAEMLAKCVVLSYYEDRIAETFDKIEPIASQLQSGGPTGKSGRDLLRHIGTTLSIQRTMVGHVEIDEKPEILWDMPELERLYLRLLDEYEIKERHTALKHKLDLIYRTAETMNGLLAEKRMLHAEWYIVILIVISIAMTVSEMFF
ncbi:MAG: RMD1 family protein [Alphaproteobacteria bacterium]|nr:RMD1 family protein [Alphaproteobacteria bacterium]